jgi:hypothetical protein
MGKIQTGLRSRFLNTTLVNNWSITGEAWSKLGCSVNWNIFGANANELSIVF